MDQFRQSTSLTAIASTIRSTIGTRSTPATVTATNGLTHNPAASKYIAFPATMPNVIYQGDSSQPSTRSYVVGSNAIFTVDFSGGTPRYQAGTFDTSAPSTLVGRAASSGVRGMSHDIDEFFHHVVKGGERLAKMAWKSVDNVVIAVLHTAENEYDCVIHTLEDAVKAVAGFIKSVVADIRKVIEWLSALFDLPVADILCQGAGAATQLIVARNDWHGPVETEHTYDSFLPIVVGGS